jgi:RNA polymerase sigma factor (sigma-70 family)
MPAADVTDEQLLTARDAASFELFYMRHVDAVLAYFSRRTRDPELSADLCAETFAAALAGRHRFRPGDAPATAWLFGIGSNKLADAQRRGYAERRAQRRLGMERIELSDADLARIDRLGEGDEAHAWMERLAPEQRSAVRAHVIDERPYGEIAGELHTSEAVVRKRVSRGLAAMRQRMGAGR